MDATSGDTKGDSVSWAMVKGLVQGLRMTKQPLREDGLLPERRALLQKTRGA